MISEAAKENDWGARLYLTNYFTLYFRLNAKFNL